MSFDNLKTNVVSSTLASAYVDLSQIDNDTSMSIDAMLGACNTARNALAAGNSVASVTFALPKFLDALIDERSLVVKYPLHVTETICLTGDISGRIATIPALNTAIVAFEKNLKTLLWKVVRVHGKSLVSTSIGEDLSSFREITIKPPRIQIASVSDAALATFEQSVASIHETYRANIHFAMLNALKSSARDHIASLQLLYDAALEEIRSLLLSMLRVLPLELLDMQPFKLAFTSINALFFQTPSLLELMLRKYQHETTSSAAKTLAFQTVKEQAAAEMMDLDDGNGADVVRDIVDQAVDERLASLNKSQPGVSSNNGPRLGKTVQKKNKPNGKFSTSNSNTADRNVQKTSADTKPGAAKRKKSKDSKQNTAGVNNNETKKQKDKTKKVTFTDSKSRDTTRVQPSATSNNGDNKKRPKVNGPQKTSVAPKTKKANKKERKSSGR